MSKSNYVDKNLVKTKAGTKYAGYHYGHFQLSTVKSNLNFGFIEIQG